MSRVYILKTEVIAHAEGADLLIRFSRYGSLPISSDPNAAAKEFRELAEEVIQKASEILK